MCSAILNTGKESGSGSAILNTGKESESGSAILNTCKEKGNVWYYCIF